MVGSPAFQITLPSQSIWRGAVLALTLAVIAVLIAWAVHPGHSQDLLLRWLAFVSVAAVLGLAVSLWRMPAFALGWDGESWQVSSLQHGANEPLAGNIELHLDLGHWMLLRFIPQDRTGKARPQWLPVQRAARDPLWHSLRCALYGGRSARRRAAADVDTRTGAHE